MKINNEIFEAYHRECEILSETIERKIRENDENAFNGREWCEENDIPESVFADVIIYHLPDTVNYGISPMRPFLIEGEE